MGLVACRPVGEGHELARAARLAAEQAATAAKVRLRRMQQLGGLLVGVELTHEGYAGTILPELLKRGVTAAWTLNAQGVIRLEPPLIVSSAQIAAALQAFDEAVEVALRRLGTLTAPSVRGEDA